MTSITAGLNGLFYIFILIFLTKIVLKSRDFYFNSIFRPIDMVTKPILQPMQKVFPLTRTGVDYTPFIVIICIYILKSLFGWLIMPPFKLKLSFIENGQNIFIFLMQVFFFCLFVVAILPRKITNPVFLFFEGMVRPFSNFFGRPFKTKGARLFATFVGTFLLASFIFHLFVVVAKTGVARDDCIRDPIKWLESVLNIVYYIILLYRFIIIMLFLSAILTWMNLDVKNPIVTVTYGITEPIMSPIRRLLPTVAGLDFSPWLAAIILYLMGSWIIRFMNKLPKLIGF